ncbi:tail fiber assembly protein [Glaciimonas immobilis]|uniref:Tail fiber assembly protein n=1 Tax=Glaciimonas immobilis TaxID=728004 RepID=A0A840RPM0_9BURK|nr:tail fiber assembly protein [Glaciimonas immobilis]KAF3999216.1 tail fiber assembly protein [Glaciimonas immobilis]MBB5198674.1 hypothetical protein [Glaciimonas immobilis]
MTTTTLPPVSENPYAYTDVRQPVRMPNGIQCDVKFANAENYVSFLATPKDFYEHGRQIYAECDAGKWGLVVDYVPTDEELSRSAYKRIYYELSLATNDVNKYQDRIDLNDATDTDRRLAIAWKTYRAALNRIPEKPDFPNDICWPAAPNATI